MERFYAPKKDFFEKQWILPDVEKFSAPRVSFIDLFAWIVLLVLVARPQPDVGSGCCTSAILSALGYSYA